MNKFQSSSLKVLVLLGTILMTGQGQTQLNVSLDGVSPSGLSEDIEYSTNNNSLFIKLTDPVICHRRQSISSPNVKATIVDPNGDAVDTVLNGNLAYDLITQVVNADVSDSAEVCVTSKGAHYGDLIFSDGFLPVLSYEYSSSQAENGVNFSYKIKLINEKSETQYFDFVEYVSKTGGAYFEDTTPFNWNCSIVNLNNGASQACPQDFSINYGRAILNAQLFTDQAMEIEIERMVDANAQIGQQIDLLSGVFVKASKYADSFTDVFEHHKKVSVINNAAPTVYWAQNYGTLQFTEDDLQATEVSFFIDDSTGADFLTQDLTGSIISLNDKLDAFNIDVEQINSDLFKVTFEILPQADKFTEGAPETIRVQVADSFGLYSNIINLSVEVTPVNDAPVFDVACLKIVIDPSAVGGAVVSCETPNPTLGNTLSGNFIHEGFFANVSPGPYEGGQTLSFSITPGSFSGDGVLDQSFLGGLQATSDWEDLILFTNNGVIGQDQFKLTATDGPGASFSLDTLITVEVRPVTYAINGTVIDFPLAAPPATYSMNLYVHDGVSQYDYQESITISTDNNNTSSFSFNTRVADGADFYVEHGGSSNAGSNCSIVAQGSQAGQTPRHQEVINAADANVVLDCSQ